MFKVIGSCWEGYVPQSQRVLYAVDDGAMAPTDSGESALVQKALECSNPLGETPWFPVSSIFSMLYSLVEGSQLLMLGDEVHKDYMMVNK